MDILISNSLNSAPIGALIALLVAFHERIDASLHTPSYRLVPIWHFYGRNFVRRIPIIGLIALILMMFYILTGCVNLLLTGWALTACIVFLLTVSWLIYEIEDSDPVQRWTANTKVFTP